METYFATAEKTPLGRLVDEIDLVSKNPVVSGLLHSMSGLLAVLDERRQVVALNDSFLQMIGIHDPADVLGLRPGEVLHCLHAHEEPAGCGTTKYCSTCGAAVAIASSLGQDKPVERICALSAERAGKTVDVAFLVRSHPLRIDTQRFLLLFMQDITNQQHRAALERTFFHDINNMLCSLVQASELLVEEDTSKLAEAIHRAALRLTNEVTIQQCLSQRQTSDYQPLWYEFTPDQIIEELKAFFANHPTAQGKTIDFSDDVPRISIKTDISLLSRVLCNMIINALEATDKGDTVRVWLERTDEHASFHVWNRQAIPQEIAQRVFQRNFSTKEQPGRGIGTYSMKLFGEEILGGNVSFTTSEEKGTVFRFDHPL